MRRSLTAGRFRVAWLCNARKPFDASRDRPQLSTTIRWKRTRPTCSKQPASVSITPWPTPLLSPSPPACLPACLPQAPPPRAETHALSRGRACVHVYAWTRGGPAPPGLELNSHVRSSEPGLLVCQGNIILGDDAYTPRRGYLASTRGSGEREGE